MNWILILLIGVSAGIAVAVVDALIAPVVHGWRADRHARAEARRTHGHDADPLGPIDGLPSLYTASFGARLVDNLFSVVLVAGVVLAIYLAGFL